MRRRLISQLSSSGGAAQALTPLKNRRPAIRFDAHARGAREPLAGASTGFAADSLGAITGAKPHHRLRGGGRIFITTRKAQRPNTKTEAHDGQGCRLQTAGLAHVATIGEGRRGRGHRETDRGIDSWWRSLRGSTINPEPSSTPRRRRGRGLARRRVLQREGHLLIG